MALADRGERVDAERDAVHHNPTTGWHERLAIVAVVEVAEAHRLAERVEQRRPPIVVVLDVVPMPWAYERLTAYLHDVDVAAVGVDDVLHPLAEVVHLHRRHRWAGRVDPCRRCGLGGRDRRR